MKKKSDICTIMYTSGTTGDPKGVMLSNNAIISLIAGVKHLLASVKAEVNLCSSLPPTERSITQFSSLFMFLVSCYRFEKPMFICHIFRLHISSTG